MIKKIIAKKQKGVMDDVLPLLFFVFVACVLIIFTINTDGAISSKNELDNIAREYMLKMETDGGLTESDQTKLIERLQDEGYYATSAGCKDKTADYSNANISVTLGDTTKAFSDTTVGYGNPIKLSITVYKSTEYNMAGLGMFKKVPTKMSVSLLSTSKE